MFFLITDVEYYFLMFYKIKYCLQIWDVVNLVLYLQRTSRQGTPTERGIPVNSSMAKGDEENGMGWHSRNNKRVQGQNGNGNGRKSWSLRPSLSPHMQMLARYECFSRERERETRGRRKRQLLPIHMPSLLTRKIPIFSAPTPSFSFLSATAMVDSFLFQLPRSLLF